jgi:predicted dehydrogenase
MSDARPTPRLGIVGAGLIGHKRAAAWPNRNEVRAVYDLDPTRARALADSYVSCRVADSFASLVDGDDVDVVVVATTHDQLAALAIAAVTAGKHVLVEKPGGISVADLEALAVAVSTSDRTVRVGFNHRFHPGIAKAHELAKTGQYGPLMWMRGRYGHGGRPGYDREWRANRAISGGGQLIDQGVHLIDLVHHFGGVHDLAYASLPTRFWDMPVEDNAFLALRSRTGTEAWMHASWTEWKNLFSFELAYRDAKLELTGLGGSYGADRLTLYQMLPGMGPPETTMWEWPMADRSWDAEMRDLIDSINDPDHRPRGATIEDTIAAWRVIEDAYAQPVWKRPEQP